jgi:hypothetical protein
MGVGVGGKWGDGSSCTTVRAPLASKSMCWLTAFFGLEDDLPRSEIAERVRHPVGAGLARRREDKATSERGRSVVLSRTRLDSIAGGMRDWKKNELGLGQKQVEEETYRSERGERLRRWIRNRLRGEPASAG